MTSPKDNSETIHDNPTSWVSRHIAEYVETEGRKGHRWSGVDTLLLITKGRRTGNLRRTALTYGTDGSKYVVVGSRGGHRNHPAWYLNLVANPHVRIQVGSNHFEGVARTAVDGERLRLWEKMSAIWPQYDDYQKRTDREIPIVVIEVEST